MVCANPDIVVQRGDKLIYCGGSLADLYESLGGRVTMAGKPFSPIYDLALKEAEAQGKGAASLDGKMIDAASEKMANNLLATAAAIKRSEAARA